MQTIPQWSQALINGFTSLGLPEALAAVLAYGIGGLVLVLFALTSALFLVWVTRKVIGRIQDRIGPNRLGPYGLFQTVADALKLLSKEDIIPTAADKPTYNIAPVLSVFEVLMVIAVVPFASGLIGMDLNIGVLYVVALGSIGVMAALMAGWGSNNKYALLSGFRVVAQLLSYEIPMVLSILTVILLAGTMRLGELARLQGNFLGLGWFGFVMPGALLIFFISSLAESEQTPFDLLEAESELIAGFHIEYSGMKFAMFFLAQFLNSWMLGVIAVTLFLGGWQGPLAAQFWPLGLVYFFIKVYALYLLQQWIKGTFPRMRVDQMMYFAWKVLVPVLVALVVWQAIALKLPVASWLQYVLVFLGNIAVIGTVMEILKRYFKTEAMRTKRSFEPASLIGTVQPANTVQSQ